MNDLPKIYLYRRILNAKLFIDQSYSLHLDLDSISSEASFSKFHFVRIFRNIYGKTPHQYLTAVRIDQAKRLLKINCKVSETCFAVGFESVSTFTTLFKEVVGQTPARYQLVQLKRQSQITETPLKFIPNCFAEKNGWSKTNSNFR